MDSLLLTNLKSLIILVHLSGLAFGVGGAWILDIYILRKLYNSPVTNENIQIIRFVSKIVTIGLAVLWGSGLLFIAFYSYAQPELLMNQKVWAKGFIVALLTINGYYLHEKVLPIILNNENKILIQSLQLKEINTLTVIGTISFVSWPLAMMLGVFKSINFSYNCVELLACYFVILGISLTVALTLKGHFLQKEMGRKIQQLSEHLSTSREELKVSKLEIKVLTKALR